ncbi:MAG: glycosyltransferase, partial [Bacteroidota bacterium]|nr:glycosyltransferase [Bacteroidota bacterium]
MKRAYISVINDLATDQRVGRVAKLLVEQGFDVICLGRSLKKSPDLKNKVFQHRRYRMLFTGGPLFYACFNLRLLTSLLFAKRPVLLISNDLDTLPANFLVSRIRRVPLIYDSHELFTQVPELIHRKAVQFVWKGFESWLLPKLRYAVTVNYSIATIYRRLYGTRFSVVRNVPEKIAYTPREDSGTESQIIIYQGALNVGRGLELMIDAMQYLENVRFVIVGSGDIEDELRKRADQKNLGDRVEFKGRMMPEELIPLTLSADLGISLEEDLGLNYRYSLPNKLFDYIQCRVPVLCSALPEMSRIVDSYGIGISTKERDPEKLAGIIRYMLKERTGGAWWEALDRAANELCWENESAIYLELLRDCGAL